MRIIYIYIAMFLLYFSTSAFGQSSELGSWNVVNIKYTFNDNMSVFWEAQLRSLHFYDDFHYYEYKGGFDFKALKNLKLTLGAGSYQTYKEGGNFVVPKNNNEFRIWPQVVLSQKLGAFTVEQRYRAEFRYTSNGYRNRYRYRLGIAYPFGKESNGFKALSGYVPVTNSFLQTRNRILKEIGRCSLLTINRQSLLLFKWVICINLIIK